MGDRPNGDAPAAEGEGELADGEGEASAEGEAAGGEVRAQPGFQPTDVDLVPSPPLSQYPPLCCEGGKGKWRADHNHADASPGVSVTKLPEGGRATWFRQWAPEFR